MRLAAVFIVVALAAAARAQQAPSPAAIAVSGVVTTEDGSPLPLECCGCECAGDGIAGLHGCAR